MRIGQTNQGDFFEAAELAGIEVPIVLDQFLGSMSEANAVAQFGGQLNNPQATSYVARIGNAVLAAKPDRPRFDYKFEIVKSDTPNAFALPNGSVYVTQGMLRVLRNDAQLAAILGHEIGHAVNRHGASQLGINLGTLGALEIVGRFLEDTLTTEDLGLLNNLVFSLASTGYSRTNESVADKDGQEFATAAGFDPMGMVDVMEMFEALEGERPGGLEQYFRSHPFASERKEKALRRLGSLPKGGETGQGTYQTFLTTMLGVNPDEATKSPVEVARLAPQGKVVSPTEEDPMLIPGIVVLGGVSLLLIIALLR